MCILADIRIDRSGSGHLMILEPMTREGQQFLDAPWLALWKCVFDHEHRSLMPKSAYETITADMQAVGVTFTTL